jgi:putative immunity protein/bacteriocin
MVFSLMVGLFSFVSSPGQANATSVTSEDCPNCDTDAKDVLAALEEEGTIATVGVDKSTEKKVMSLVKTKDKEYKDIFRDLKNEGYFQEKLTDTFILFEDLKDKGVNYSKVAVFSTFYVPKKENTALADTLVSKQVWINLETNEIIKYDLVKADEEDSESLAYYDIKGSEIAPYAVEGPPGGSWDSKKKFKINGISFACSLSGLFVCTTTIGGVVKFVPWVGAAVSTTCAVVFATGCAFT